MIRAILYLVISIFLITFVRMVVGIIMRSMGDMLKQPSSAGSQPQSRPSAGPLTGELKRDPVCGTFVPVGSSFSKTVGGQAYHFCSVECRDKYA